MGTHIHLLIKPHKGESLSNIMKWIQQTFAIRYNKEFKQQGHVWRERFHSVVLVSREQVIKAFNYITQKPENTAKPVNADQYKFSGFFDIINKLFDVIDPPGFIQNFIDSILSERQLC